MSIQQRIINNYVNGLFMKKIMKEKGWTKQDAVYAVVAYLSCGRPISAYDFFKTYQKDRPILN